jgi:hypothetical protein
MTQIKIFDSFGVELETENIDGESEIPERLGRNFSRHPDASIETDKFTGRKLLFNRQLKPTFKKKTVGTEFVSKILDIESPDSLESIRKLTDYLTEYGESFESFRAGIHVHINFGGYNLNILKNVMRLARLYEPVFFYLGTMGYKFRGIDNDSIYCRPITQFGPVIVNSYNGKIQSFNVDDLLLAKSTEDFWYRYGAIIENNPPNKYNPIRYNWITLYNLLTKGTVEFRVFNKSLSPDYILAMVDICKNFSQRSFDSDMVEDVENSIYTTNKIETMNLFYQMVDDLNISQKTTKIASFILKTAPEINFPKEYCYTHLRNYSFPIDSDREYSFRRITEYVKSPSYVDIHTLRGE